MSTLLRQTEELLDVAVAGSGPWMNTVIVLDRDGGLRMFDPAGWSMMALRAEFGAAAVFRIERRGLSVRVEGCNGGERCLLERRAARQTLADLPGVVMPSYTDGPLLSAAN